MGAQQWAEEGSSLNRNATLGLPQGSLGRMERMEPFVLESCNSTWLFDTERGRFRRVLKGLDIGRHPTMTEWRSYARLEVDPRSEAFVVILNEEGTRMLRSWRHTDRCSQCGGRATAELSLAELRAAIA